MKDVNRAAKRRWRAAAIRILLLLLSLGVMAVSGYELFKIREEYREGDQSYTELAGKARPGGQPAPGVPQAAGIPEPGIDFTALRAVNPDAAAWLYCPDTAIDYPVMAAADYDYYLHRLPDGTYNSSGSLFIDYNHAPDFTGRLTVIYGHNMKNGKMFGSLTKYKKQAYFDANPYMYLYTAGGQAYRIKLVFGCVIGAGQWRQRAFMSEENLDALLAYAKKNSTFASGAAYTAEDRFVALSTCSYEFDEARYVVLGVLSDGS
jgi:sortase B